jgi:outer membrane protein OmpA-like peptidoglycan-associated protein
LADGNEQGVSPAPRGGWPDPSARAAEVAGARLMPDPREAPGMLPVPGVAKLTSPTTGVTPEEETVDVADVSADGAAEGMMTSGINEGCALDQIYNVIGFNENSNELTPRLEARLDQIIEDIGNEKCRILVTGYSSTQGSHATNALFAVERAQNVLSYLRQNGLHFEKATAAGGGGTTQFGDDFASNRRVVITVTP